MNDAQHMKEVCNAMTILGLTAREQGEILAIVASVLHLGNIDVNEEQGTAVLDNFAHIFAAAEVREFDKHQRHFSRDETSLREH